MTAFRYLAGLLILFALLLSPLGCREKAPSPPPPSSAEPLKLEFRQESRYLSKSITGVRTYTVALPPRPFEIIVNAQTIGVCAWKDDSLFAVQGYPFFEPATGMAMDRNPDYLILSSDSHNYLDSDGRMKPVEGGRMGYLVRTIADATGEFRLRPLTDFETLSLIIWADMNGDNRPEEEEVERITLSFSQV